MRAPPQTTHSNSTKHHLDGCRWFVLIFYALKNCSMSVCLSVISNDHANIIIFLKKYEHNIIQAEKLKK
jgi:hypothetical protein